jgi:hypothetical protein
MLYPYHSINGQIEPILTQTRSIILQNNVTYNKNVKYSSPKDREYIYIKRSLEKNDETMDELFNFCHKLDKYMENNKQILLEECNETMIQKIKETGRTYCKLIDTDLKKGQEWIKLKLSLFSSDNGDDDAEKDKPSSGNIMTRIFYKNDVYKTKNDKWKDHKLDDLRRILRANTKVRFMLSVNKLWYNAYNYGIHIKVIQMEIDESLSQRFQVLKKLKENNKNMFSDEQNKNTREKIFEIMENRNIYGMNKKKVETDNNKIIAIIKNNSSMSMFDETEYAPATAHFSIDI